MHTYIRVGMVFMLALFFAFATDASAQSVPDERSAREELVAKLSHHFSTSYVERLFENLSARTRIESPECRFLKERVDTDIARRQGRLPPQTGYLLTGHESLPRGILYYREHREAFLSAERRYGVPPEVILGIFRMENWFGACVGEYYALPILVEQYESVYIRTQQAEGRKALLLSRKEQLLFREIHSLILYCTRANCNPNALPASSAGAIGYSEFLPSNIIPFAADGNGDGVVDLFNHADAIVSTARYLFAHGFAREEGLPAYRFTEADCPPVHPAHRAVWRYNKWCEGYVAPVFRFADAIRPLL